MARFVERHVIAGIILIISRQTIDCRWRNAAAAGQRERYRRRLRDRRLFCARRNVIVAFSPVDNDISNHDALMPTIVITIECIADDFSGVMGIVAGRATHRISPTHFASFSRGRHIDQPTARDK